MNLTCLPCGSLKESIFLERRNWKMRNLKMIVLLTVAVGFILVGSASAVKPGEDVNPNGFPSGDHYNLNIIGKKQGFNCPDQEVDENGNPRTAPFGSLRAMTSKLLRLICYRYHDTFTNLTNDGRVVATLIAPPDIAVSVYGIARLVRERMEYDENYALFDIEIEHVKNDMVRTVTIDSGIMITPREEFYEWFDWGISELEGSVE